MSRREEMELFLPDTTYLNAKGEKGAAGRGGERGRGGELRAHVQMYHFSLQPAGDADATERPLSEGITQPAPRQLRPPCGPLEWGWAWPVDSRQRSMRTPAVGQPGAAARYSHSLAFLRTGASRRRPRLSRLIVAVSIRYPARPDLPRRLTVKGKFPNAIGVGAPSPQPPPHRLSHNPVPFASRSQGTTSTAPGKRRQECNCPIFPLPPPRDTASMISHSSTTQFTKLVAQLVLLSDFSGPFTS
ncbi:hypothetical protein BDZ91DRAFT_813035 [Kalaharituber pfeilii]|nr:hypothetical protein BDZ91DRAFT_813035 [Kalaharituber pfeilii]